MQKLSIFCFLALVVFSTAQWASQDCMKQVDASVDLMAQIASDIQAEDDTQMKTHFESLEKTSETIKTLCPKTLQITEIDLSTHRTSCKKARAFLNAYGYAQSLRNKESYSFGTKIDAVKAISYFLAYSNALTSFCATNPKDAIIPFVKPQAAEESLEKPLSSEGTIEYTQADPTELHNKEIEVLGNILSKIQFGEQPKPALRVSEPVKTQEEQKTTISEKLEKLVSAIRSAQQGTQQPVETPAPEATPEATPETESPKLSTIFSEIVDAVREAPAPEAAPEATPETESPKLSTIFSEIVEAVREAPAPEAAPEVATEAVPEPPKLSTIFSNLIDAVREKNQEEAAATTEETPAEVPQQETSEPEEIVTKKEESVKTDSPRPECLSQVYQSFTTLYMFGADAVAQDIKQLKADYDSLQPITDTINTYCVPTITVDEVFTGTDDCSTDLKTIVSIITKFKKNGPTNYTNVVDTIQNLWAVHKAFQNDCLNDEAVETVAQVQVEEVQPVPQPEEQPELEATTEDSSCVYTYSKILLQLVKMGEDAVSENLSEILNDLSDLKKSLFGINRFCSAGLRVNVFPKAIAFEDGVCKEHFESLRTIFENSQIRRLEDIAQVTQDVWNTGLRLLHDC